MFTTSVALTQPTIEKLLQDESEHIKLKDELISLREKMKKQRKVENNMISLNKNILEHQEKLHDVKVECFTKIQKMDEKIKALESHLEIVSQTNSKMQSLQVKIKDLDRWRDMENNVPSSIPMVQTYDIKLHTLAMNECQELVSKFEEKLNRILQE